MVQPQRENPLFFNAKRLWKKTWNSLWNIPPDGLVRLHRLTDQAFIEAIGKLYPAGKVHHAKHPAYHVKNGLLAVLKPCGDSAEIRLTYPVPFLPRHGVWICPDASFLRRITGMTARHNRRIQKTALLVTDALQRKSSQGLVIRPHGAAAAIFQNQRRVLQSHRVNELIKPMD